jgi:hypothetical protein
MTRLRLSLLFRSLPSVSCCRLCAGPARVCGTGTAGTSGGGTCGARPGSRAHPAAARRATAPAGTTGMRRHAPPRGGAGTTGARWPRAGRRRCRPAAALEARAASAGNCRARPAPEVTSGRVAAGASARRGGMGGASSAGTGGTGGQQAPAAAAPQAGRRARAGGTAAGVFSDGFRVGNQRDAGACRLEQHSSPTRGIGPNPQWPTHGRWLIALRAHSGPKSSARARR